MKNLLYYIFALSLLISCGPTYDPMFPDTTDPGDVSGGNDNTNDYEDQDPPVLPSAFFSVSKRQPLTIVCSNRSSNATHYRWDFGDGHTSTDENPVHKYDSKGVYRVRLYAYNNDYQKDEYEQTITVEAPRKIYFKGITYEKLSVNNTYVRFTLVDDDIFTTTWVNSTYKLLSTANLPYDFILQNPVLMDGLEDDEWYAIYLYSSDTPDGDGTSLAGFQFDTAELLNNYPEGFTWSEYKGCKISCYFMYE